MLTHREMSRAGWPARWKAAPPQPRRVLGSPSWGPPAPALFPNNVQTRSAFSESPGLKCQD